MKFNKTIKNLSYKGVFEKIKNNKLKKSLYKDLNICLKMKSNLKNPYKDLSRYFDLRKKVNESRFKYASLCMKQILSRKDQNKLKPVFIKLEKACKTQYSHKQEVELFKMQKFIKKLKTDISKLSPGKKIGYLAKLLIKSKYRNLLKMAKRNDILYKLQKPRNCGDWVDSIMKFAGIKKRKWLYHDISYGKGKPKKDPSRRDCGNNHASDYLTRNLKEGDYLWINNKNQFDPYGNHSGIFLGWKNKAARVAIIANFVGGKKPLTLTFYGLKKYPLTHISRPI